MPLLMSELGQVIADLGKINQKSAALLLEELESIACPDAVKLQWASQCLNIADSGWHAWKSVDVFIVIGAALCHQRGSDELLRIGDYACQLNGYSFEPCRRYFLGIETLLGSDASPRSWQNLNYIEETGSAIHEKYQHASNLISDYFAAAFDILFRFSAQEIEAWSQLASRILLHDRGELLRFINLVGLPITWSKVMDLQDASPRAFDQLLVTYSELEAKYGQNFIEDIQPMLVAWAKNSRPIGPFLDELVAIQGRTSAELWGLLSLLPESTDIGLTTSMIRNCHALPLNNKKLVHAWFSAGIQVANGNYEAGLAFFELDSSSSIQLLEKLKGQVSFADCKRVLQLYAEAISGRKVRVASFEELDLSLKDQASTQPGADDVRVNRAARSEASEDYRELPIADGLSIVLPDCISLYETVEENFRLYKVSLLHQLGYFEFDTFDQIASIEEHICTYDDQILARALFQILEDARIDWRLERKFRGAAGDIKLQKKYALIKRQDDPIMPRAQLLEVLVRASLGGSSENFPAEPLRETAKLLRMLIAKLDSDISGPKHTLEVLDDCYGLICVDDNKTSVDGFTSEEATFLASELPAPVVFHGEMDTKQIAENMEMLEMEEAQAELDDDMMSLSFPVDPDDLDIEELKKGDVSDAMGMLVTDLDAGLVDIDQAGEKDERKSMAENKLAAGKISRRIKEEYRFLYDEWDHIIDDYRHRWCTLYESRDLIEEADYVQDTLTEHGDILRRVRKQLNKLKPELLRKVKGVPDGDEMDLERTIEAVVDRKMGFSPSENIYIQRQRKDRDVSALFLLDMSASTDDLIPDPDAEPQFTAEDYEDEDFLTTFFARHGDMQQSRQVRGKRIIDLEKESVILMAEALEELGDSYSICGFSGYGKDRIDYFLCKDFKDPYDIRAKGRIGGLEPARSTRMGPAIRHATKSLVKTESRIKAMFILSDGYPQDFDYGKDRSSKEYGVKDTMKALAEARQQGVQTFCLTVDPSGHDYLREMCPDKQYMVIQDITQLPDELSKVYRSLTG